MEHRARVVHQDGDRAEVLDGALERRVDLLTVPHIGGDAQGADRLRGRCARVWVAFPYCDRGAECGEARRDTAADARTAARHHRDFAGQQNV